MDENELLRAIQRFPNKQCASGPILSWLLKKISGMILPFVKSMVNQSFSEGIVPKSCKSAQITPLLKKPSLDYNVASFYIPISNLPVFSKLSESIRSAKTIVDEEVLKCALIRPLMSLIDPFFNSFAHSLFTCSIIYSFTHSLIFHNLCELCQDFLTL